MMNRTSANCCPLRCALPALKSSRRPTGARRWRRRAAGKHFPVRFLTAEDDTEDKVTGLTVGGDDYVARPFSLDEVVARIRAVLRRTQPMLDDDEAVIRVD